jgi:hypothetical protein
MNESSLISYRHQLILTFLSLVYRLFTFAADLILLIKEVERIFFFSFERVSMQLVDIESLDERNVLLIVRIDHNYWLVNQRHFLFAQQKFSSFFGDLFQGRKNIKWCLSFIVLNRHIGTSCGVKKLGCIRRLWVI